MTPGENKAPEKKCNHDTCHGSAVNAVCKLLDYDVIIMKTLNRDLSKNCDIILGEGARWAF